MTKRNLIFAFLFVLSSCIFAQSKKINIAIIAFYNVENLYDTIDDPITDDKEFLPNGIQNWNSSKYNLKIERISEVISKIGQEVLPGGPTIIGLSEIENRGVLEALINSDNLKSKNYGIIHYNSPDRRGVDVALLYQKSRFVVEGSQPMPLRTSDTAFRTRDQLLVWGKLDGEQIYFLVNHWPSRRGGEQRSAPKRRAAAELSRHISDSLMKLNPNVKIVIMGDLNDNPTNASITKYLKAKGRIDEVTTGDLYDPMLKLYQDGIGSYAYRDSWDLYDQIIVSFGLTGNDYSSFKLMKAKIFNDTFLKQKTGTFTGYPWRTAAGGQYLGGYSDHFPVYGILGKDIK
ncbi:MAG: endonuclease/exonuclease/phosphatase family protein [Bacteroidota bacterium]